MSVLLKERKFYRNRKLRAASFLRIAGTGAEWRREDAAAGGLIAAPTRRTSRTRIEIQPGMEKKARKPLT
jgi:hypothetical protein